MHDAPIRQVFLQPADGPRQRRTHLAPRPAVTQDDQPPRFRRHGAIGRGFRRSCLVRRQQAQPGHWDAGDSDRTIRRETVASLFKPQADHRCFRRQSPRRSAGGHVLLQNRQRQSQSGSGMTYRFADRSAQTNDRRRPSAF